MRFKGSILFLLVVFCVQSSFAQLQKGELVQSRILILLDESSSMVQNWAGGKEKYRAADDIILKLMDSVYAVNNQVEFSLRVFGHQNTVQEKNCYDTRNEVPYAKDNKVQMALRLADIHPLGVTPIAYSLEQAAEHDLTDVRRNVYSIILITDGGESCGGDICEVMKKLIKDKVYFKPYIVSLENDPALKMTYACMGDFLQVTKPAEIPGAVGTIVNAFRQALKINTTEYADVQSIAANAPSVLKVSVPPVVPEKTNNPPPPKKWKAPAAEKIVRIAPVTSLATMAINPVAGTAKTVALIATPLPAAVPPAVKVASLRPGRLVPLNTTVPGWLLFTERAPKLPLPDLVIDIPPPPPPPPPARVAEKLARIQLAKPRHLNVIYVIEDHTLPTRQVPALPPVKAEIAAIAPKLPRTLGQPPAGKKIDYRVTTEDNSETTVEIYFTNGHGKYYTTMPQVLIVDPANKGIVKKFYRTVDANGNPDPQPDIPPGSYDLAFTAKRNLVIHNIDVQKNKKNKVTVTVNMTSLSFAYMDAGADKLSDRPVSEFTAVVTERNKSQGRVQVQKCTEAIEYEPGNYHIEINTFPKEIRNVDLDFDDESVIKIAQPGFAKFTGETKTRYVTLYQRLGDKFLSFHTLDLSDPASKHLAMQPGEYQAHYQKGPGQSAAAEQVIPFLIVTTKECEVLLK